jgi:N-acetylmuramoyl-L-alanine amidase
MLKIHSFLQRIKNFLCNVLPNGKEKYKMYMAMVSYTMLTVLILISPNYIYGTESNKNQALEKVQSEEPVFSDVKEETDNEAIIRVKQPNPEIKFILYDFRTQNTSTGNEEYLTSRLIAENKARTTAGDNIDNVPEEQIVSQESFEDVVKEDITVIEKDIDDNDDKKVIANSNTDRADAKSEVDNSSTKEKETLASVKYVIDLKKADVEVLQRIVEAEATGEDVKGKMLVANVILNRVKDEYFPDTVEEVVFQKSGNTYQFSPIKDKRYWTVKISEDTITAVDRVMQGEDSSQGALYFSARQRADKNSMKWFDNNLKFLFQYGGHEFFKNK